MSLYLNDIAKIVREHAVEEIAAVNSVEEIGKKLQELLTEKGYLAATSIGPVATDKGAAIGIGGRPKKKADGGFKWILTFSGDSIRRIRLEILASRSFFKMPEGRSEYRRFFKGESKYGRYCSSHTFKEFVSLRVDMWLNEMTDYADRLYSIDAGKSQLDAWFDCRRVLGRAFDNLSEYSYDNYRLLFEYSLPQLKTDRQAEEALDPLRADVVLLTHDSVVVLEFKQSAPDENGEVFEGYVRQAQKYRRRLVRFHMMSHGMDVSSILVLTKAEDVFELRDNHTFICSPDRLSTAIVLMACGGSYSSPMTEDEFEAWLDTDFGELPPQEYGSA